MATDKGKGKPPLGDRRPLASRERPWAGRLLRFLLRTGLTANQISALGIVFALAGATAFVFAARLPEPVLWIVGALCIQLRLVANLMDGLVAVEGGRGSTSGALWNEAPDRLEDSLFLVAFGYAPGVGWLGWLAALLAAVAAYVRLLGGTVGLKQDFRGPMAKQHRMAALTLAAGIAFAEALLAASHPVSTALLGLIAFGTVVTIGRRLKSQAEGLAGRAR